MKPTPEFATHPPGDDPLELGPPAGPSGHRRLWLVAVALLAIAAGMTVWLSSRTTTETRYLTTPLERGTLEVRVSATGTLQPTNQVDVGSELSGTVQAVLVDDNSRVARGQELARLDVSRLDDQIRTAQAALQSARAGVLEAKATRDEAGANLARLRKVHELSGGKVPSAAELDTAAAGLERARSGLAAAEAGVAQAQAALSTNRTNRAKASIRSPIDGIVLSRQVEPGQTVAASLQAPVLFTLAEDLAKMDLEVKVDEADVGQVREGQSAEFTVDAYPGRRYPAQIRRVAYGATTTDNVVSYVTVLTLDNADLSLRPGMTATAEILVDRRQDVWLVPNAALRFTPPRAVGESAGGLVGSLLPRPPRTPKQVREVNRDGDLRSLWILRNGQAEAIEVRVGATNGRQTEVSGEALAAGTAVVTGTQGGSSR
ncbi:MAG: efflux RND transporter periplasmic adaptor subunit [Rhodocyclaceae bacterium]|nr:efflux RND transporter periplasmic adaptor subunit [Rhodocyclaceae bacterium]